QPPRTSTPRHPWAPPDPSGVPVFDRPSPLTGQHHPTILPASFVTKAASEVHLWSRIAADADQVARRPPSRPTASHQASTTQVGQAAALVRHNWEYLVAAGFIGLGAVV